MNTKIEIYDNEPSPGTSEDSKLLEHFLAMCEGMPGARPSLRALSKQLSISLGHVHQLVVVSRSPVHLGRVQDGSLTLSAAWREIKRQQQQSTQKPTNVMTAFEEVRKYLKQNDDGKALRLLSQAVAVAVDEGFLDKDLGHNLSERLLT